MADLRYPGGSPIVRQDPISDPDPTDEVDREFQRLQSQVMRTRSPFEPPEGVGVTPRIVPLNLFRMAQGDEIRTQAEALAIQHDTADEQFNMDVDATKRSLGGFNDLNSVLTPERRVEQSMSPNAEFLHAKTIGAVAEIRRLFQDTSQMWAPAPVDRPEDADIPAQRYLEHLSTINERARMAYRGLPSGGDGTTPITMPAGMFEQGNINLSNRPRVRNADGSISTVRSISVEQDGNTYLIPTVVGDKVVSNDEAIKHFKETNEHLGVFADEKAADAYARTLHDQQASTLDPESSLDEMEQGRREAAAIRAGTMQPKPEVSKLGPGDATESLARAASTFGEFFDGKEFWRSVWVDGGAGIATMGGAFGDYDEARNRAADTFDKAWNELPRPAQIFVEQLNPGNVALALTGGPLANVLRASEVKGAGILAGLVDSLAANPVKAVSLQVLTGASSEYAYERTEGQSALVRVGASLAAGGLTIAATHGAEVGVRAAFHALSPDAIEPNVRAFVTNTAQRPVDALRESVIDFKPGMDAATLKPGTIVRMNREQAIDAGAGSWRDLPRGFGGSRTYTIAEDGSIQPFYLGPEVGTPNMMRPDGPNIARGKEALLSRFDMESRFGRISGDDMELGREFIDALPPGYLNDLGSSYVNKIPSAEGVGTQGGEQIMGLYTPGRSLVTIAKSMVAKSGDPAAVLIHEVSHHLEQFVSADDAMKLQERYFTELPTKGLSAIRRYDELTARATEMQKRLGQGATAADRRAIADVTAQRAQAQREAYRYRSFNEWFAETLTEQFQKKANQLPADSLMDRIHDTVTGVANAAASAARKVGGYKNAEDAFNSIMQGEYDPDVRRSMFDTIEQLGMVGYSRDVPQSLVHAMGDGGLIKMGDSKEMFDPIAHDVMTDWREGDVLQARLIPGNIKARVSRPSGSKATIIPDVIPVTRPTNVHGLSSPATTAAGRSLLLNTSNATERAMDLASQLKTTVADGIAHALMRGDAKVPDFDNLVGRGINWFNQASRDRAHRGAQNAARIVTSELATRFNPSRAQFTSRLKEMFGSTNMLPASIEYIGPATRTLHGGVVAAAEYPTHGTILDFVMNPGYYNADITKYLPEFVKFDARNSAVTHTVEQEFGLKVGDFDTGIASAANGGHGIFFPSYDAGVGKVGRGSDSPGGMIGGSLRERTFRTIDERLADPDELGFEPVTDIAEMFARLDQQKIGAASMETYRYGVGGSMTHVPGWQEVPALNNISGQRTWLPPEMQAEVTDWMQSSEHALASWLEGAKNMHLGGDISPLSIQGTIGWALSPIAHSREMWSGMRTGVQQGGIAGIFRPFTNEALYQDIAAAPERWTRFFSYTGFTPTGGTPAEWRAGFLERLPIIGKGIAKSGDAMSNVLMRGMESDFNEMGSSLIARGIAEEEAWATASDVMKMGWLQQNFNELGVSAGRRSIERGAITSTTFIRQPANLMAHAAIGIGKLAASPVRLLGTAGQWAQLTPREQLATQYFAKMTGTFSGIAAFSALMTAKDRGYTPQEALQRSLVDVNGPDWMRLHLSKDVSVPLGGAFRSLIRAAMPGPGVAGEYTPFAGMGNYIKNRITPLVQTVEDVAPFGIGDNTDFYGNKIVTKEGLVGLAQGLMYAGAQSLPTVFGQPYQSMRAGESPMQAIGETASQYLGQNPTVASQHEVLERERRLGAHSLYDMPSEQKVALGMTPEQAKASSGAQTLTQLRNIVGSRAANALTELANPAVAGAKQAYIDDLHRRADAGDKNAEALIVSVETQEQLQAVADSKKVNGVLDGVAYREARTKVIDNMVGRSQAYKDVFDGMKQSGSLVDQLSSQWYDLFDKARTYGTVQGRQVPLDVDYAVFDELESHFFASMTPDMAALVQQNVAAVPMGGGQAEVDLRSVRSDLAQAGYWEISDDTFATLKPKFQAAKLVPESVQAQADQAQTFVEYRQAIVSDLAQRLAQEKNFAPATALQFAKSLFDQRPEARAYDKVMMVEKAKWAQQHVDDGLAERAIQWGYLSDSQLNLAVSGAVPGVGTRPAATPSAQPAAPAATPAAEPYRPAVPDRGAPRSEVVTPPADLTEQLVAGYRGGDSYAKLAIRFGITEDAARGRIRRASGDNPASLRA